MGARIADYIYLFDFFFICIETNRCCQKYIFFKINDKQTLQNKQHQVKESGCDLKLKEDEYKENKIKENFFVCSQCNYKSKKEGLFKKHMLTKHKDHMCKECNEKFPSSMELLKHVAKHHINETNEGKDLKDQGEEVIHFEEDQDKVDIKDSDEVKKIKRTKNIETTDYEERKKVLSSVNLSFLTNFVKKVFQVI